MATQSKVVAPGASINGWQPGFRILGIKIDNPTGSWIFIQSNNSRYNWYVPPYTVQWSKALDPTVISIKMLAGNGPAGKVGTSTGSNWTAIVSSVPYPDSDGNAIIIGDNPTIIWASVDQFVDGTFNTLITPPTGQALRIFTINIGTKQLGTLVAGWQSIQVVGSFRCVIDRGAGTSAFAVLSTSESTPTDDIAYGQGLDLVANQTVRYVMACHVPAVSDYLAGNLPLALLTVSYGIV